MDNRCSWKSASGRKAPVWGDDHRNQVSPGDRHRKLRVYPTDAPVIDCFFRRIAPDKGPRALGPMPRLGIGTRMTTAVWPAIWQAMAQGGFAANAIQNSVRELNFLETLLEGRPAEKNIAFGFGTIETGYTGSSYEGLWVAGVLDALKHGAPSRYGADADHIQVKRGADGLAAPNACWTRHATTRSTRWMYRTCWITPRWPQTRPDRFAKPSGLAESHRLSSAAAAGQRFRLPAG